MIELTGAKGESGGGGDTSNRGTEIASVAYMKLLYALSEGEVEGGVTGQKIKLNGTPLIDENGIENFPGVTWEFRSGTQDQDYIQGFPAVANETSVGFDMKAGTPWVKSINNTQLSAVRLRIKFTNGVYYMRESGGKDGYRIEYAIDISIDGSTYTEYGRDAADGIADSGYERSYRIDLPAAQSGWQIRVRRITPENNDGRHADAMRIESMTQIVDAKLRYPHTALLFIQFDSKLFDGQTPTVTVLMKGIKVRVPSNYDPVMRVYSGSWDGTFKFAWTDNVVWQFYDLALKGRYGTGRRLALNQIDKWGLYKIAQYQDQMVSNGIGGEEVRSKSDLYITQRADAWQVLMDMVNSFQGMMGWSNNLLTIDADMPRKLDPDFVFSKSNIVGSFKYAGSSERANYSAGIATYSNPATGYADDQATVFVPELSKRFGVNSLEISATGCTRESEAQRRLLWAIHTNNQDDIVEFKTGQEGRIPRLGKVIGVNNGPLAGRANGGRVAAAAGTKITLDRDITVNAGDRLIVNLPSGIAQGRTVKSVSGRGITVESPYSETPATESGWVLDQHDLAIEQYRVNRIVINDDKTVTISGIPYSSAKFDRIDNGAIIEERPVTVVPPRGQSMPGGITITGSYRIEQGISIAAMEAAWQPAENAVAYEVQWRKDSGNWINAGRTGNTLIRVDGIYAGRYVVRVRAINAIDVTSMWATSSEVVLAGKAGNPPSPQRLTASDNIVWNIDLHWLFPDGAGDTAYTEIEVATTPDGQNPQFLAYVPYPGVSYQHGPMPAGVRRWYRARLVDRIGNKGDWTAFVAGMSSVNASELLDDELKKFLTAEDGKALVEQVQTDPEAILQNILAEYETVNQQWAHYGENRAAVIQAQSTAADAQKSVAKLETDVTASFDKQQAAIQQKMTAYADVDNPSAIYTLKAGIKYNGVNYDAGLSVAATVNGSKVDTRFAVNANQFVVISGDSGNYYSPFIIKDGQMIVNTALIGNATITSGMIGQYIQSIEYVPGKTGWHINKNGSAEFNNVTVRGAVYATSGNFKNVTIEENCDVKGTVYANKIVGDVVSSGVWKKIGLQGVNGMQTRYFNGGLPYESTVVILSPGLKISGSAASGRTQIWVNGVNIYDNLPRDLNSPIMFDVPANGSAKVEFVITGVSSSTFWTSDADLVVMAFKKSENRFS